MASEGPVGSLARPGDLGRGPPLGVQGRQRAMPTPYVHGSRPLGVQRSAPCYFPGYFPASQVQNLRSTGKSSAHLLAWGRVRRDRGRDLHPSPLQLATRWRDSPKKVCLGGAVITGHIDSACAVSLRKSFTRQTRPYLLCDLEKITSPL